MWKQITEARKAAIGAAAPKRRVWLWPSVGVAAALLLSVGIVIGRRMDRSAPAPAVIAVNPVVVKPVIDSAKPATKRDSLINELHEESKKTGRAAQALAVAPPRQGTRSPSGEATVPGSDQNLAYRLVVLRHLAGSEAMITSFRSSAHRGDFDNQIASWSKELLSTTRLLEGSQAAVADPMMKRLLEDLDLVISQIVQYTTLGKSNSDELDLIEQSINKRGVITNLRRATVSRPLNAGT
jgi:hypothetical protein